jgi:hypothetical protein
MASKPKPSAAEIAEEKMPGWKVVKPSGPIKRFGSPPEGRESADLAAASEVQRPEVDAVMPSTKQLRRKFFGDDAAGAADDGTADALAPDVEVLDMKSGDLERTVGVNRRTGKIDWSAG